MNTNINSNDMEYLNDAELCEDLIRDQEACPRGADRNGKLFVSETSAKRNQSMSDWEVRTIDRRPRGLRAALYKADQKR